MSNLDGLYYDPGSRRSRDDQLPRNEGYQYYPRYYPSWSWFSGSGTPASMSYPNSEGQFYVIGEDGKRIDPGSSLSGRMYDNATYLGYKTHRSGGSYKLRPGSDTTGSTESYNKEASRRRCCVVMAIVGLFFLVAAGIAIGVYFGVVDEPDTGKITTPTEAPPTVRSFDLTVSRDVPFDNNLYNPYSNEYQTLKTDMEGVVDNSMSNSNLATAYKGSTVTGFWPGSTIAGIKVEFKAATAASGNQVIQVTSATVDAGLKEGLNRQGVPGYFDQGTIQVAPSTNTGTFDLGQNCTTNATCEDNNAYCSSQLCTCLPTHYDSNGPTLGGACVPKVNYGVACVGQFVQCATNGAECTNLGTCLCPVDKYYDGVSACFLKKVLDDDCTDSLQCGTDHSICQDVCKCAETYYKSGDICKAQVGYNGTCDTTLACSTVNATCTGQKCLCSASQYLSDNQCLEKKANMQTCGSVDECSFTETACIDGLCQCPSDRYEDGETCLLKVGYNETCSSVMMCSTKHAECTDQKCQCATDRFLSGNECFPKIGDGLPCNGTGQCSVSGSVCLANQCTCPTTMYLNAAQTACLMKKVNGQPCGSVDECSYTDTACVNGNCTCPNDRYEQGTACLMKKINGQTCNETRECWYDNAECIDEKCDCPTNMYEEGTACYLKKANNQSCSDGKECAYNMADCLDQMCKCPDDRYESGTNCMMKKINEEACNETRECMYDNAECINQKCDCPDNMYLNETACYMKKNNDEACQDVKECMVEDSVCSNNLCDCPSGFYNNGTNCLLKKFNGLACMNDTECSVAGASCISNVCNCPATDFLNGIICSPKIVYNDACTGNSDHCLTVNGTCLNFVCTCAMDKYYDNQTDTCMDKLAYGSPCTMSDQCETEHSECIGDVCSCPSDRYRNDSSCLMKKNNGQPCTDSMECGYTNAECLTETCGCPASMYELGTACFMLVGHNETCSVPIACSTKFANCTDQRCQCADDRFFSENDNECFQKIGDGQACNSADECSVNASVCVGGQCTCPTNMYLNNDQTACLMKSGIGESCQSSDQCLVENSICGGDNLCVCNSTVDYLNQTQCVPKKQNGVSCGSDNECLIDTAQCLAGVCSCLPTEYLNGMTCSLRLGFGVACNGDVCMSMFECIDQSCQCPTGYFYNGSACQMMTTTTPLPTTTVTDAPDEELTTGVNTTITSDAEFNDDYNNRSSDAFKALEADLTETFSASLAGSDGPKVVGINIVSVSSGSVITVIELLFDYLEAIADIAAAVGPDETASPPLSEAVFNKLKERVENLSDNLKEKLQETETFKGTQITEEVLPQIIEPPCRNVDNFLNVITNVNGLAAQIFSALRSQYTALDQGSEQDLCRNFINLINGVYTNYTLSNENCENFNYGRTLIQNVVLPQLFNSIPGIISEYSPSIFSPCIRGNFYRFGLVEPTTGNPCTDVTEMALVSEYFCTSHFSNVFIPNRACGAAQMLTTCSNKALVDLYPEQCAQQSLSFKESLTKMVDLQDKLFSFDDEVPEPSLHTCQYCIAPNLMNILRENCGHAIPAMLKADDENAMCGLLQEEMRCLEAHASLWEADCPLGEILQVMGTEDAINRMPDQVQDMDIDINQCLSQPMEPSVGATLCGNQHYIWYLMKYKYSHFMDMGMNMPENTCSYLLPGLEAVKDEFSSINLDCGFDMLWEMALNYNEEVPDIMNVVPPYYSQCLDSFTPDDTCQVYSFRTMNRIMEGNDPMNLMNQYMPNDARPIALVRAMEKLSCGFAFNMIDGVGMATVALFEEEGVEHSCGLDELIPASQAVMTSMGYTNMDLASCQFDEMVDYCSSPDRILVDMMTECGDRLMNSAGQTASMEMEDMECSGYLSFRSCVMDEMSSSCSRTELMNSVRNHNAFDMLQTIFMIPEECIDRYDNNAMCPDVQPNQQCSDSLSCNIHSDCFREEAYCCETSCGYQCLRREEYSLLLQLKDVPWIEEYSRLGSDESDALIDRFRDLLNLLAGAFGARFEDVKDLFERGGTTVIEVEFSSMSNLHSLPLASLIEDDDLLNEQFALVDDLCFNKEFIREAASACFNSEEFSAVLDSLLPTISRDVELTATQCRLYDELVSCTAVYMRGAAGAFCDPESTAIEDIVYAILRARQPLLPEDKQRTGCRDEYNSPCSYASISELFYEECAQEYFQNSSTGRFQPSDDLCLTMEAKDAFQDFVSCALRENLRRGDTCDLVNLMESLQDIPQSFVFADSTVLFDCLGYEGGDPTFPCSNSLIVNPIIEDCFHGESPRMPLDISVITTHQCPMLVSKAGCAAGHLLRYNQTCGPDQIITAINQDTMGNLKVVVDNCAGEVGSDLWYEDCYFPFSSNLTRHHRNVSRCYSFLKNTPEKTLMDLCGLLSESIGCVENFVGERNIQCGGPEDVKRVIVNKVYEEYLMEVMDYSPELGEHVFDALENCQADYPVGDICEKEDLLVDLAMTACERELPQYDDGILQTCRKLEGLKQCLQELLMFLGEECSLGGLEMTLIRKEDRFMSNFSQCEEEDSCVGALAQGVLDECLNMEMAYKLEDCRLFGLAYECLMEGLSNIGCSINDSMLMNMIEQQLQKYSIYTGYICQEIPSTDIPAPTLCGFPRDLALLTSHCNMSMYMLNMRCDPSDMEALRDCYGDTLDRYSSECVDDRRMPTIDAAIIVNAARNDLFNVSLCFTEGDGFCPIASYRMRYTYCEHDSVHHQCLLPGDCDPDEVCCLQGCEYRCVPSVTMPGEYMANVTLPGFPWSEDYWVLDDPATEQFVDSLELEENLDFASNINVNRLFPHMDSTGDSTGAELSFYSFEPPSRIESRWPPEFVLEELDFLGQSIDHPGVCPNPDPYMTSPGYCYETMDQCEADQECDIEQKCCHDGCKMTCQQSLALCDRHAVSRLLMSCLDDYRFMPEYISNDFENYETCRFVHELAQCMNDRNYMESMCGLESILQVLASEKDRIMASVAQEFGASINITRMFIERWDYETCKDQGHTDINPCKDTNRLENEAFTCLNTLSLPSDFDQDDMGQVCRAIYGLQSCVDESFSSMGTTCYEEYTDYGYMMDELQTLYHTLKRIYPNAVDIENVMEQCEDYKVVCTVRSLRELAMGKCMDKYFEERTFYMNERLECGSNETERNHVNKLLLCLRLEALSMGEDDCKVSNIVEIGRSDQKLEMLLSENCVNDSYVEYLDNIELPDSSQACYSMEVGEYLSMSCFPKSSARCLLNATMSPYISDNTACMLYYTGGACINEQLKNRSFDCAYDMFDVFTSYPFVYDGMLDGIQLTFCTDPDYELDFLQSNNFESCVYPQMNGLISADGCYNHLLNVSEDLMEDLTDERTCRLFYLTKDCWLNKFESSDECEDADLIGLMPDLLNAMDISMQAKKCANVTHVRTNVSEMFKDCNDGLSFDICTSTTVVDRNLTILDFVNASCTEDLMGFAKRLNNLTGGHHSREMHNETLLDSGCLLLQRYSSCGEKALKALHYGCDEDIAGPTLLTHQDLLGRPFNNSVDLNQCFSECNVKLVEAIDDCLSLTIIDRLNGDFNGHDDMDYKDNMTNNYNMTDYDSRHDYYEASCRFYSYLLTCVNNSLFPSECGHSQLESYVQVALSTTEFDLNDRWMSCRGQRGANICTDEGLMDLAELGINYCHEELDGLDLDLDLSDNCNLEPLYACLSNFTEIYGNCESEEHQQEIIETAAYLSARMMEKDLRPCLGINEGFCPLYIIGLGDDECYFDTQCGGLKCCDSLTGHSVCTCPNSKMLQTTITSVNDGFCPLYVIGSEEDECYFDTQCGDLKCCDSLTGHSVCAPPVFPDNYPACTDFAQLLPAALDCGISEDVEDWNCYEMFTAADCVRTRLNLDRPLIFECTVQDILQAIEANQFTFQLAGININTNLFQCNAYEVKLSRPFDWMDYYCAGMWEESFQVQMNMDTFDEVTSSGDVIMRECNMNGFTHVFELASTASEDDLEDFIRIVLDDIWEVSMSASVGIDRCNDVPTIAALVPFCLMKEREYFEAWRTCGNIESLKSCLVHTIREKRGKECEGRIRVFNNTMMKGILAEALSVIPMDHDLYNLGDLIDNLEDYNETKCKSGDVSPCDDDSIVEEEFDKCFDKSAWESLPTIGQYGMYNNYEFSPEACRLWNILQDCVLRGLREYRADCQSWNLDSNVYRNFTQKMMDPNLPCHFQGFNCYDYKPVCTTTFIQENRWRCGNNYRPINCRNESSRFEEFLTCMRLEAFDRDEMECKVTDIFSLIAGDYRRLDVIDRNVTDLSECITDERLAEIDNSLNDKQSVCTSSEAIEYFARQCVLPYDHSDHCDRNLTDFTMDTSLLCYSVLNASYCTAELMRERGAECTVNNILGTVPTDRSILYVPDRGACKVQWDNDLMMPITDNMVMSQCGVDLFDPMIKPCLEDLMKAANRSSEPSCSVLNYAVTCVSDVTGSECSAEDLAMIVRNMTGVHLLKESLTCSRHSHDFNMENRPLPFSGCQASFVRGICTQPTLLIPFISEMCLYNFTMMNRNGSMYNSCNNTMGSGGMYNTTTDDCMNTMYNNSMGRGMTDSAMCFMYTEIADCGYNATQRLYYGCSEQQIHDALMTNISYIMNTTGINITTCDQDSCLLNLGTAVRHCLNYFGSNHDFNSYCLENKLYYECVKVWMMEQRNIECPNSQVMEALEIGLENQRHYYMPTLDTCGDMDMIGPLCTVDNLKTLAGNRCYRPINNLTNMYGNGERCSQMFIDEAMDCVRDFGEANCDDDTIKRAIVAISRRHSPNENAADCFVEMPKEGACFYLEEMNYDYGQSDSCEFDDDCEGTWKCCYNGSKFECAEPAKELAKFSGDLHINNEEFEDVYALLDNIRTRNFLDEKIYPLLDGVCAPFQCNVTRLNASFAGQCFDHDQPGDIMEPTGVLVSFNVLAPINPRVMIIRNIQNDEDLRSKLALVQGNLHHNPDPTLGNCPNYDMEQKGDCYSKDDLCRQKYDDRYKCCDRTCVIPDQNEICRDIYTLLRENFGDKCHDEFQEIVYTAQQSEQCRGFAMFLDCIIQELDEMDITCNETDIRKSIRMPELKYYLYEVVGWADASTPGLDKFYNLDLEACDMEENNCYNHMLIGEILEGAECGMEGMAMFTLSENDESGFCRLGYKAAKCVTKALQERECRFECSLMDTAGIMTEMLAESADNLAWVLDVDCSEQVCSPFALENALKDYCESYYEKYEETEECWAQENLMGCTQFNALARKQGCDLETLNDTISTYVKEMGLPGELCPPQVPGSNDRLAEMASILPQNFSARCTNPGVVRAILQTECLTFPIEELSPEEQCSTEISLRGCIWRALNSYIPEGEQNCTMENITNTMLNPLVRDGLLDARDVPCENEYSYSPCYTDTLTLLRMNDTALMCFQDVFSLAELTARSNIDVQAISSISTQDSLPCSLFKRAVACFSEASPCSNYEDQDKDFQITTALEQAMTIYGKVVHIEARDTLPMNMDNMDNIPDYNQCGGLTIGSYERCPTNNPSVLEPLMVTCASHFKSIGAEFTQFEACRSYEGCFNETGPRRFEGCYAGDILEQMESEAEMENIVTFMSQISGYNLGNCEAMSECFESIERVAPVCGAVFGHMIVAAPLIPFGYTCRVLAPVYQETFECYRRNISGDVCTSDQIMDISDTFIKETNFTMYKEVCQGFSNTTCDSMEELAAFSCNPIIWTATPCQFWNCIYNKSLEYSCDRQFSMERARRFTEQISWGYAPGDCSENPCSPDYFTTAVMDSCKEPWHKYNMSQSCSDYEGLLLCIKAQTVTPYQMPDKHCPFRNISNYVNGTLTRMGYTPSLCAPIYHMTPRSDNTTLVEMLVRQDEVEFRITTRIDLNMYKLHVGVARNAITYDGDFITIDHPSGGTLSDTQFYTSLGTGDSMTAPVRDDSLSFDIIGSQVTMMQNGVYHIVVNRTRSSDDNVAVIWDRDLVFIKEPKEAGGELRWDSKLINISLDQIDNLGSVFPSLSNDMCYDDLSINHLLHYNSLKDEYYTVQNESTKCMYEVAASYHTSTIMEGLGATCGLEAIRNTTNSSYIRYNTLNRTMPGCEKRYPCDTAVLFSDILETCFSGIMSILLFNTTEDDIKTWSLPNKAMGNDNFVCRSYELSFRCVTLLLQDPANMAVQGNCTQISDFHQGIKSSMQVRASYRDMKPNLSVDIFNSCNSSITEYPSLDGCPSENDVLFAILAYCPYKIKSELAYENGAWYNFDICSAITACVEEIKEAWTFIYPTCQESELSDDDIQNIFERVTNKDMFYSLITNKTGLRIDTCAKRQEYVAMFEFPDTFTFMDGEPTEDEMMVIESRLYNVLKWYQYNITNIMDGTGKVNISIRATKSPVKDIMEGVAECCSDVIVAVHSKKSCEELVKHYHERVMHCFNGTMELLEASEHLDNCELRSIMVDNNEYDLLCNMYNLGMNCVMRELGEVLELEGEEPKCSFVDDVHPLVLDRLDMDHHMEGRLKNSVKLSRCEDYMETLGECPSIENLRDELTSLCINKIVDANEDKKCMYGMQCLQEKSDYLRSKYPVCVNVIEDLEAVLTQPEYIRFFSTAVRFNISECDDEPPMEDKPGMCPHEHDSCYMQESCSRDSDCKGIMKCCHLCDQQMCVTPEQEESGRNFLVSIPVEDMAFDQDLLNRSSDAFKEKSEEISMKMRMAMGNSSLDSVFLGVKVQDFGRRADGRLFVDSVFMFLTDYVPEKNIWVYEDTVASALREGLENAELVDGFDRDSISVSEWSDPCEDEHAVLQSIKEKCNSNFTMVVFGRTRLERCMGVESFSNCIDNSDLECKKEAEDILWRDNLTRYYQDYSDMTDDMMGEMMPNRFDEFRIAECIDNACYNETAITEAGTKCEEEFGNLFFMSGSEISSGSCSAALALGRCYVRHINSTYKCYEEEMLSMLTEWANTVDMYDLSWFSWEECEGLSCAPQSFGEPSYELCETIMEMNMKANFTNCSMFEDLALCLSYSALNNSEACELQGLVTNLQHWVNATHNRTANICASANGGDRIVELTDMLFTSMDDRCENAKLAELHLKYDCLENVNTSKLTGEEKCIGETGVRGCMLRAANNVQDMHKQCTLDDVKATLDNPSVKAVKNFTSDCQPYTSNFHPCWIQVWESSPELCFDPMYAYGSVLASLLASMGVNLDDLQNAGQTGNLKCSLFETMGACAVDNAGGADELCSDTSDRTDRKGNITRALARLLDVHLKVFPLPEQFPALQTVSIGNDCDGADIYKAFNPSCQSDNTVVEALLTTCSQYGTMAALSEQRQITNIEKCMGLGECYSRTVLPRIEGCADGQGFTEEKLMQYGDFIEQFQMDPSLEYCNNILTCQEGFPTYLATCGQGLSIFVSNAHQLNNNTASQLFNHTQMCNILHYMNESLGNCLVNEFDKMGMPQCTEEIVYDIANMSLRETSFPQLAMQCQVSGIQIDANNCSVIGALAAYECLPLIGDYCGYWGCIEDKITEAGCGTLNQTAMNMTYMMATKALSPVIPNYVRNELICNGQTLEDKPGECPEIPDVGACDVESQVDECSHDVYCPETQKCCSNGCGRVCREPQVTEEENRIVPAENQDDPCDNEQNPCPPNAECIDGRCYCQQFNVHDGDGNCIEDTNVEVPKVKAGGKCSGPNLYCVDNAECNKTTGLCECDENYIQDRGGCLDETMVIPAELGDDCDSDQNIICVDDNAECSLTTICECDEGYVEDNGKCIAVRTTSFEKYRLNFDKVLKENQACGATQDLQVFLVCKGQTMEDKPGECPEILPDQVGACGVEPQVQECNHDMECPEEAQKCCFNGCGRTCMNPEIMQVVVGEVCNEVYLLCDAENAACNSSYLCGCDEGYIDNNFGQCIEEVEVGLGEECYENFVCEGNAVCNGECVCDEGYKDDGNGKCIGEIGKECKDDTDCYPEFSICDLEGFCACDAEYTPNNDNTECTATPLK